MVMELDQQHEGVEVGMGGVESGAGGGQFGSMLVGIAVASLVGQEDVAA